MTLMTFKYHPRGDTRSYADVSFFLLPSPFFLWTVNCCEEGGPVTINGQLLEAIFLPRLGTSLQSEMESSGGMDQASVLGAWAETLDALRYIHSRGFSYASFIHFVSC